MLGRRSLCCFLCGGGGETEREVAACVIHWAARRQRLILIGIAITMHDQSVLFFRTWSAPQNSEEGERLVTSSSIDAVRRAVMHAHILLSDIPRSGVLYLVDPTQVAVLLSYVCNVSDARRST